MKKKRRFLTATMPDGYVKTIGPTATEFFTISGTPIPGGKAQPASAVVDAALKAIDAGKPRVVPAPLGMRIGMALMHALPIKTALGASK